MASPAPSTEKQDPLQAVLQRLSGSSGFPTLSTTITDVNRVVASDSHSAQQVTQGDSARRIADDQAAATRQLRRLRPVSWAHLYRIEGGADSRLREHTQCRDDTD